MVPTEGFLGGGGRGGGEGREGGGEGGGRGGRGEGGGGREKVRPSLLQEQVQVHGDA